MTYKLMYRYIYGGLSGPHATKYNLFIVAFLVYLYGGLSGPMQQNIICSLWPFFYMTPYQSLDNTHFANLQVTYTL